MKRLIIRMCGIMLGIVLLCIPAAGAHIGIEDTEESEKIQVVQLLEIMNGDEYGNLNLDAPVTRAEFVKMVISASSYKDSVSKTSNVSLFPDVTSTHWAAGYISTAVKNGLLTGYLDGTFRPENQVKLEEAVIVTLKLLGYTTADFKGTYPESQLAKYDEIDLDTDMLAVRGDVLTRRECMKLLYNALCTTTKQGTYYCTVLGHGIDARTKTIDYEALLEDDMAGPYVNTADALWNGKVTFEENSNAVFYCDGKKVDSADAGEYDIYYYSEKTKTVWFYTTKKFGKITSINPNTVSPASFTVNGRETYALTADSAKKFKDGGFDEEDYVMVLFDKDDKVAETILADYEMYSKYADDDLNMLDEINGTVSDPIVVTDDSFASKIPLDLDSADILLDGDPIAVSDIQLYDVLYYSKPFNSVWVFRDTENGVCTAVTPNRENPSSIVVGGKTHMLSTDDAKFKFSSYGTLKDDMLVTLILGKDGSVVDALPAGKEVIGDGENQVSYNDVVNATLKGPYVVKESGKLLPDTKITLSNAVIYKENKTASVSDIKQYNVYYYSKLLNTVWIYDDTESGTVEAILPNKVSPSSVTVSGATYSLESAGARYEFSSMGSFGIGDRVTLLLGKDGTVAGVVKAGAVESDVVYGVVLGCSEKTYTDADGKAYVADTVTVYTVDNKVYTYQNDSNFDAGDPVKVVVGDSKVSITGLSSPTSPSSAVKVTNAIKNGKFADDAKIIEYFDSTVYAPVLESRITGLDVWYSSIIYYSLNSNDEVEILILDNYTGDLVEYGLLTEVNGSTYSYITDGVETVYSSGDIKFTVSEGVAYFAKNGQQISKIGNIKAKIEISAISGNKAYTSKNAEYIIDDNVRVYISQNGEYKVYGLDELKNGNYSYMEGYYDKAPADGGKIRVIIAR